MSSKVGRRRRRRMTVGGLISLALSVAGMACRSPETRFEVLAFKNPQEPERYAERFGQGSYCTDAHGNWTMVFELPPTAIGDAEPPAASQPSAPGEAPDAAAARSAMTWMAQYIQIDVFWKPRPGTTYAESSQTNASIVYTLTTSGNSITYEGAGFVYFSESWNGKTITGQIESATLYPARSANEPTDVFGPCRLKGTFTAREDRSRVVAIGKQLRRRLGPAAGAKS